MKKLLFSFLFLFCFVLNSFALRFDILGTISYKNAIIKGDTYLKINENVKIPFSANADSVGVNIGLDLFFTDYVGLYTRLGFYGLNGLERSIDNKSKKIKNATDYGSSFDVGAAFAIPFNNYFSITLAPALTMNYINSNYTNIIKTSASVDSYLNYGFTGDIYIKFRYKHFVAAIGCAGSILPFGLVTSSDTAINYGSNIQNCIAYSLRPYIGAGVSF